MKKIIIVFLLLISTNVCFASETKPLKKPAGDTVLICDSKYAFFYHTHVCNGLTACKHQIIKVTVAQAAKLKYKPCPICYPRLREKEPNN